MSLFGKGGKPNNDLQNHTSPSPLDINNPKDSIESRFDRGYTPPTFNQPRFDVPDGSRRTNTLNEYSDMSVTDKVEDERIKQLRIDGYKIANEERVLDIQNKRDFTLIVKISVIIGVLLIVFAFILYFGLFSFLSIKNGVLVEKNILNTILDTFLNILKLALS